jgi:hypothetical protein
MLGDVWHGLSAALLACQLLEAEFGNWCVEGAVKGRKRGGRVPICSANQALRRLPLVELLGVE